MLPYMNRLTQKSAQSMKLLLQLHIMGWIFFFPHYYTYSQVHEFDELRFDIRGHECTYFLRASSVEEKDSWVEAIEGNKVHTCT